METNYSIQYATSDHIEYITKFNSELAFETENKYLEPDTARKAVEKLLADPDSGFSVIALEKDKETPVAFLDAYLAFDYSRNEQQCIILSTLVSKEHRRRGLFNKLYAAAIKKLRAKKGRYMRLFVEKDNKNAMEAYKKIGFKESNEELFEFDLREDPDSAFELQAGYSRLLDEEDFTLERAEQEEIKKLEFADFTSILHKDGDYVKAKAGALRSFEPKSSAEIFLLKQKGEVIGIIGGYITVCDWTNRLVSYINDIRLKNSVIGDSRELTGLILKLYIDKIASEGRHLTIYVGDAEEWVKLLLRTARAITNHYLVYEQDLS